MNALLACGDVRAIGGRRRSRLLAQESAPLEPQRRIPLAAAGSRPRAGDLEVRARARAPREQVNPGLCPPMAAQIVLPRVSSKV